MHINRIKVEFKDKTGLSASELAEAILIESKWNLKSSCFNSFFTQALILIESKWNLKKGAVIMARKEADILIESKWNLKY